MTTCKYALAALALAISTQSLAASDNYKHLGERPASGRVETRFYSFAYSPPSETYGSISWNAYRDKSEKRNTVMVVGLSGYDTYALSVLYKGQRAPGQAVADVAKQQHSSLPFAAGPNPSCVNTPLDRPFELDKRMVTFTAICVDSTSDAIYELSISWQSLILAMQSLETITKESQECANAKAQDPSTRCPDRIGTYAGAYTSLLSSFALSGK